MIPHKWGALHTEDGHRWECSVCGAEGVVALRGFRPPTAHLPGEGVRISDDCDEARREIGIWRGQE